MGMEKQAVNRRRDTSAFKNRFSLYKQGIPVYDRGRIIPYEDRDYDYAKANELGYTPDETGHMPTRDYKTGAYLKSVTHPTLMKSIVSDLGEGYIPTYNEQDGHMYSHRFPDDLPVREESKIPEYADGKLPGFEDGKDLAASTKIGILFKKPESKRARAMYNSVDPRGQVPESYLDAVKMEAYVRKKMYFGNPDSLEYEVGTELPDRVSDAAWRKRLGYSYNHSLLIPYQDGVRLPSEIENEIPTDTTMLKNRIAATQKLMNYSRKYKYNEYVQNALEVDQKALESLRKTYKTGQPVNINEHAFNSRQWVSGGKVIPTMSPLNVLGNFTVQYDKKTNTMNYKDTYDFNEYDWAIPGKPFNIGGQIKLNPIKTK